MTTTTNRIGDHKFVREIGQGGFGRTILAERFDGKRIVIKEFNPSPGNEGKKAASLFRSESERLKQVGSHDRIPTFLEYFEEDGKQYIAQQFLDGLDLEAELTQQGHFSETHVREVLDDLLPLVEFIHGKGLIHRDIKPANIIRRSVDNKLCLVDFGAAKIATQTALAKTGTSVGSYGFTAPEQLHGKGQFASDIYSLGATCIYLLTGILPTNLINIEDGSLSWQEHCKVSPELEQILSKMVATWLRDRYTTASEASKDVNAISGRIAQRKKSAARDLKLQKMRRSKLVRSAGIGMASTALLAVLGLGIWKVAPVLEAQLRENQPTSVEQPTSSPSQDSEPTGNDESSPSIEVKLIEAGFPVELAKAMGVMVVLVQVGGGLAAAGSVVSAVVSHEREGGNHSQAIVGVTMGTFIIFVMPRMILFMLV